MAGLKPSWSKKETCRQIHIC